MSTLNIWKCSVLILLVTLSGGVRALEVSCSQVLNDSAASCSECENACDFDGFRVTCPGLRLKYEVSRLAPSDIQRPPLVRVYCLNETSSRNFTLKVPFGLQFSKKEEYDVILDKCPLSETPLKMLFNDISISKVSVLTIFPKVLNFQLHKTAFENLDTVKVLDLRNCGLSFLPREIFKDLTSLMKLRVQENFISLELGDETFQHLPHLKELEILRNLHVNFKPGVFKYLQNLERLVIDDNEIKYLRRSELSELSKLQTLVLQSNKIESEEIPSGFFDNLLNIRTIKFENNKFFGNISDSKAIGKLSMPLPSGLLSNLVFLEQVSFIGNRISDIPADMFINSSKIKEIFFSKNNIKIVSESTFADLVNLKKLSLSENNITQLPENIFSKNTKLTHLFIDNNGIEIIPQYLLKNQDELLSLKLNNNRIRSITGSQFMSLKKLQVLDLSNNQIKSLLLDPTISNFDYSVLFKCRQLETLDVYNNFLTEIYEDWRLELTSLTKIDMSGNNISHVEVNDFVFNNRTVFLNLWMNGISLVDFRMNDSSVLKSRQNVKLEMMQVYVNIEQRNPFNCSCALKPFIQFLSGTHLTQLDKYLFFDINNTTKCGDPSGLTMGEAAAALSQCESVKDKDCPESCSCKYRYFSESRVVNCQNSGLDRPPPTLLANPPGNHTELNLYNNSLQSFKVPDDKNYKRVTHINLANNNITQLDISGLSSKLKKLDVSNNRLERLSEETLVLLEKAGDLERLEFHDNPWSCDCDNTRLVRFVRTKTHLMRHSDKLFCSNGTLILDLQVDRMCL